MTSSTYAKKRLKVVRAQDVNAGVIITTTRITSLVIVPSQRGTNSNTIDLQKENEELLKFSKDFSKTYEKLLQEKHALEKQHSKLFSKVNELELEVKKLANNKQVVEPCRNRQKLFQDKEGLGFSKNDKTSSVRCEHDSLRDHHIADNGCMNHNSVYRRLLYSYPLNQDKHIIPKSKVFNLGKQVHASHKLINMISTTRVLELLHMDLFGPSSIQSYGGFWCHAVETAMYILNRVLIRKTINKTPYEILRGRKPSLEYFKVFGCKCTISKSLENPTLNDTIFYNDIFLRYSQTSKAYIVLNKETLKIKESLDVTFDDSLPKSRTSPLVDDDMIEEQAVQNHDKTQNSNYDLEKDIPRVENIREIREQPIDPAIGELNERTLRSHAQDRSNFFAFVSTMEPKNIKEAIKDESWTMAMQEELDQFVRNDVWDLISCLLGQGTLNPKLNEDEYSICCENTTHMMNALKEARMESSEMLLSIHHSLKMLLDIISKMNRKLEDEKVKRNDKGNEKVNDI
ncbi:retrovirus-related pol polyprotein from transposon TNT 1-94 [Tanacetum coccineum]